MTTDTMRAVRSYLKIRKWSGSDEWAAKDPSRSGDLAYRLARIKYPDLSDPVAGMRYNEGE